MSQGEQGIGEQRVKYLRRQLPTDHHGDGIGEDHLIRDTQTHSSNSQLEILYRARGRKIEELSQQLEEKEEEFGKQIRMLNHQLALIKGTAYKVNVVSFVLYVISMEVLAFDFKILFCL